MACLISQDEFQAILGRSLTQNEQKLYNSSLQNAVDSVKRLLGTDFEYVGERYYTSRADRRTLFIDPFSDISSVVVNGKTVATADYRKAYYDELNYSSFSNSIIFRRPMDDDDEVVVTAWWGYGDDLPYDIKKLIVAVWTGLNTPVKNIAKSEVKSKSIEDFTLTYDTSSTVEQRIKTNYADVIAQYAKVTTGDIDSAPVRRFCY